MTTERGRRSADPDQAELNHHAWYVARAWYGMRFGTWIDLLPRNRFRFSPGRLPIMTTATTMSATNSLLAPLESLIFGRRIAATRIVAPIFIVGHWRSGTTLLHELLALDDRFGYPTTYQCFVPNSFRLTRSWVTKLSYLIPDRRPMDNMPMGWDLPQEDEFALVNLGLPSPYLTIAFPNERPVPEAYLDVDRLPLAQRERWKTSLHGFLKSVALGSRQPLVLKSPPHTARIRALLELFPDARFVHIVRDPHIVFPSTVRLWKALYEQEALQEPGYAGLDEYVHSSFERMYAAFERQRPFVDPSRIVDVTYEDLVRDPIGRMQAIYDALDLGEFERMRPMFETYFADRRDYRTNTYRRDPAIDAEVDRRWGPYMRRYGYEVGVKTPATAATAATPEPPTDPGAT